MPASGDCNPDFRLAKATRDVARPDIERADHAADRAHRLQEPVEGSEEAEKDQHADQIARGLAGLAEPRRNAVEQGLQRGRRQADASVPPGAEHARHRRQQPRRPARRPCRLTACHLLAKAFDPVDLGSEQQHLPEDVDDADDEDDDDDAVDERVAHEGGVERPAERRRQRRDQHHEQQHSPGQRTAGGSSRNAAGNSRRLQYEAHRHRHPKSCRGQAHRRSKSTAKVGPAATKLASEDHDSINYCLRNDARRPAGVAPTARPLRSTSRISAASGRCR